MNRRVCGGREGELWKVKVLALLGANGGFGPEARKVPSEVAAGAQRLHGYQPTQLSDDDDVGDSKIRTCHRVKGLTLYKYWAATPPPIQLYTSVQHSHSFFNSFFLSLTTQLTFFVCIKVATEAAAAQLPTPSQQSTWTAALAFKRLWITLFPTAFGFWIHSQIVLLIYQLVVSEF